MQNKPNPMIKLSNIKNTQPPEFKHNKLNDLKNQKPYIYNNGLIKHMSKSNESSIISEKNDTNSIHHNHLNKNEMNRMNKSLNSSSSSLSNGNNNNNGNNINNLNNSNGNTVHNNNKNELTKSNSYIMKSTNKYKNMDYDGNPKIPLNIKKSHSTSESINYDSQDDNPSSSSSGIVMRPRRVSINNKEKNREISRESSRDISRASSREMNREMNKEMNKEMSKELNGERNSVKENDTLELPEYLTKPLIYNIKKQKCKIIYYFYFFFLLYIFRYLDTNYVYI